MPRIDVVLDVLVDGFGWSVAYDGPAADVPGRVVVLDAGGVAVTLLQPDDHGEGLLPDRSPRLSQLVVGGPQAGSVVDRLTAFGLPTHEAGRHRRFVPPEVVEGLLGFETAIVIQGYSDDAVVEPDLDDATAGANDAPPSP